MPLISEFRASLRQLCFPQAFRIPRPMEEAALLEEADSLLTEFLRVTSTQSPDVAGAVLPDELLARFATGVWRVRQRMIDPATGQPTGDFRRAYRHVEALSDVLAEFGVEIQDHTREPFDSGRALIVLSYEPEPDPSVTREVVKETVKPSVYLHERCIQKGEVIVSSPEA